MVEISCKDGILKLEFIKDDFGKKIQIKLRKNKTDDFVIFNKFITINQEVLTFNKLGQIGYFEYDIYDSKDNLLESDSAAIINKISVSMNIKTQDNKIHRENFELKSKEYEENNMIIKDKNEKIYFNTNDLKIKIKQIFEEFINRGIDFIYIQDPYFDYKNYAYLLENIPVNFEVKIIYSEKGSNLPINYKFKIIRKPHKKKTPNNIHARFIITKDFGYHIDISLNGINVNKAIITKMDDISQMLKDFN